MPQATRIVGLDVAKRKVDACIRSAGLRFSAPSTPEGEAEMILWVQANRVERAVMEASGGYERRAFLQLWEMGVSCALTNPRSVRRYAEAMGILEKTDRIDAAVIARFADAKKLAPPPPAKPGPAAPEGPGGKAQAGHRRPHGPEAAPRQPARQSGNARQP